MINIEKLDEGLKISYINAEGGLSFLDVPLRKENLFVRRLTDSSDTKRDPKFLDWAGRHTKQVKVRSAREFDKFRVEEILYNLRPEYSQLINQYSHPKKHFIDIEVLVEDEFPKAEEAKYPMTTIGIANDKDMVFVMGTKPLTADELDFIQNKITEQTAHLKISPVFKYDYYPDEYNMLYNFVFKVLPKIIFASGWNFTKYDWLYISNRCKKLNIPLEWSSPSRKFSRNSDPMHKIIVDYMDIYKKWDRTVALKESDTLDWVSKEVLGVNKIKYHGSIKDLYEKDYPLYVAYNAVDAILVKMLDVKLNTLSTFLKIGSISKIENTKAFSPVWLTDALCFREMYKRGRVICPMENKDQNSTEKKSYEGAYVKEPIAGMYDWVCCYDFASLYPSVMRQFNISPDAYKGHKKILDAGEILCASGAAFNNTEDSMFRTILDDYYGQRVSAKTIMKQTELKLNELQTYLTTL